MELQFDGPVRKQDADQSRIPVSNVLSQMRLHASGEHT
jgi:hypothetical protein